MITEILNDCGKFFGIECYTDNGDTVWVGIDESDGTNEYIVASATDGDLYSNTSLSKALSYFLLTYDMSRENIETVIELSKRYR